MIFPRPVRLRTGRMRRRPARTPLQTALGVLLITLAFASARIAAALFGG